MFLYEFEEKTFSFRKRKTARSERKLNARIKGLTGDDYIKAVENAEETDLDKLEDTIREFSDLDEFVDSMGMFDIRRLTAGSTNSEYNSTAEVKFIGTFTTKRNDYTSNIVDQIFDQLMSTKKLSTEVQDAAEKAFYWKAALREYKDINNLSYRAVARELKKQGSSLQEVTIRQWLIEESHIIGPRDAKTMRMIAEVTQDPYLISDPDAYYEACRIVRHYRREILSLIAQAINDKLSNKQPVHGSAFEVVYENVEKLSETMELENVFELDEVAVVNNSMVNRPITESEVLM